jgi:glycogen operon protein
MSLRISEGKPLPLGATLRDGGVQFAVFSRNATGVSLLLFDRPEDAVPSGEIPFDAARHRTGDIWHIHLSGLGAGQCYLYRAYGPYQPRAGHRFNPHKLLLDPYAKAITGSFTWDLADARGYDPDSAEGDLSFSTVSDAAGMPKCIVVEDSFDWQGDRPLARPLRYSVIYEAHVRGLTMHPSSRALGVRHPGTYRGVVEMIPYLKDLGVTALELLPVQEFDELENRRLNPLTGESLQNYWGYSTMSFFAPKGRYSSSGALGEQVTEFKQMVRELHRAGIEVILDMVFNHSAEGDQTGPTLCFRGWDNTIYYLLEEEDRRLYKNYSGCGNTLNCNHPIVRTLIRDCLHYWVVEMHVDGFRFDLGSVLGRDTRGRLLENPPVLEGIAEDPVLRQTKLIAEAWDAAGAYQVGSFPGGRWAEWNDRFRDDVRAFWRGDAGQVPRLATRIAGSSDLYLRDGRKPFHSINFITSHDGFTLSDLVSYSQKHNEANGEANRDGFDKNLSCNYGVEGPSPEPAVEALRNRQVKNFLATLLLSQGTPMLLGGDELRRTQRGNNNAWCQNNEISWCDWSLLERYAEIHRFTRSLISFRLRHPAFLRPEFFDDREADAESVPDIIWLAPEGEAMDWDRAGKALGCLLRGGGPVQSFLLMFNADEQALEFALPPAAGGAAWHRALDTGLEAPLDFPEEGQEPLLAGTDRYVLTGRSLAVLLAR